MTITHEHSPGHDFHDIPTPDASGPGGSMPLPARLLNPPLPRSFDEMVNAFGTPDSAIPVRPPDDFYRGKHFPKGDGGDGQEEAAPAEDLRDPIRISPYTGVPSYDAPAEGKYRPNGPNDDGPTLPSLVRPFVEGFGANEPATPEGHTATGRGLVPGFLDTDPETLAAANRAAAEAAGRDLKAEKAARIARGKKIAEARIAEVLGVQPELVVPEATAPEGQSRPAPEDVRQADAPEPIDRSQPVTLSEDEAAGVAAFKDFFGTGRLAPDSLPDHAKGVAGMRKGEEGYKPKAVDYKGIIDADRYSQQVNAFDEAASHAANGLPALVGRRRSTGQPS